MEHASIQSPAAPVTNSSGDVGAAVSAASDPRMSSIPRIPRTATAITSTPVVGTPGTVVGLPEGVVIPPGVDRTMIQGRLLETLNRLPVQLINDALVEYEEATKNKKEQIRNHAAYLFGVIKRYLMVQERAGEDKEAAPMGANLTPAVHERLQKLVAENFCTEEEMNEKVKSKIKMLSEKDALFAIDELSSVERSQIRNFGSYFMGILNRYMRGERSPTKSHSSSNRHRNSYGNRKHGDRDDRDYDRRRRHRDDDSEYRGRSHHYDKYRDTRRERSRDRYDDDHKYDKYSSGRSDYRRNSSKRSDRHNHRDSYSSSRYEPRISSQSLSQPSAYGNTTATSSVPRPPPPPPYNLKQQPQSFVQPQAHSQQLQNQQAFSQVQNSLQQQYVPQMTGQQAAFAPTQQANLGALSSAPQATLGGFPTSSTPASQQANLGALSSAPGATLGGFPTTSTLTTSTRYSTASAAPTGTHTSALVVPQTGVVPQAQNVAQALPNAGSATNYQALQQQPPPDILGLADRAASAVQALNALTAPAPSTVPVAIPQPAPAPSTNAYNGINSYSTAVAASPANSGRRTARLEELPTMVQFAVNNLKATGHVDGEVDGGILAMIKDLPESVALHSLERFSSCDTSTMRNKMAYLAGILRREQAKLTGKRY